MAPMQPARSGADGMVLKTSGAVTPDHLTGLLSRYPGTRRALTGRCFVGGRRRATCSALVHAALFKRFEVGAYSDPFRERTVPVNRLTHVLYF